MNNRSNTYLTIASILFFAALFVSGYLLWHHYGLLNGTAGFGSFCSLNKSIDCDVVNTSSYSEFFGIPLAAFALSYYLFAAIGTFFATRSQYFKRELLFLMVPLSAISLLASVFTFSVSVFIIHSFCIMCASLQLINVITAVLVYLSSQEFFSGRSFLKDFETTKKKPLLSYLAGLTVLFIFVHLFSSQWKETSIYDETQFIAGFRLQPTQKIDRNEAPLLGDDSPELSNSMSKPVQIIEFADFQCPACAMAARHMHRLLKVYGNKVQVAFKNFPLDPSCNPHIQRSIHDKSCMAAKSALCAQAQNKFYSFYEMLFSNQLILSKENIQKWATDFGMDWSKMETCMNSPEIANRILREVDEAKRLGLDSTPTFFVNGKKIEGPITEERMKSIFRELGV